MPGKVGGFLEADRTHVALVRELRLRLGRLLQRLELRYPIFLGHALQQNLLGQRLGGVGGFRSRIGPRFGSLRRNQEGFRLFGFPEIRSNSIYPKTESF